MRPLLILPLAVALGACQTATTPHATAPAAMTSAAPAPQRAAVAPAPVPASPSPATPSHTMQKIEIAPDTPQRLAQLPRTVIDYDHSLLSDNDRKVVHELIEASKLIDEVYWRQVSEDNPQLRSRLSESAGQSALQRAAYDYFLVNRGRWDRLKQNEPFIGPFGALGRKPAGAAFYPTNITKEEFESYVAAHPERKKALELLYTVIRRRGTSLAAIPYSQYYHSFLAPAAERLRGASNLTTDLTLRTYLVKLANALGTDLYRDSDMAWMDLNGPIEVVIGPYEVYEDDLFNYKAAFESFVTVVDKPESEKLAIYAKHLPDMERNLPEPEQYKNLNRGTSSPIKVVQEIYTAGDARRGVQTSAFNLPNDEFVREKKGSKKVLLKNVMDAKFRQSGRPVAMRVLDPSLTSAVSFDAYFNHTLFHELSHGLGPGFIKQANGERVEVRIPLKNLFSTIEECKADVLGLWNIRYAQTHNLLTAFDERQLYVTYTGLMFRSMRFGIDEAHGRGTAVQWNWIRENGGVVPNAAGKYTVDVPKFAAAVKSLATELLTIEATGDFNRANALLEKYGRETPEMKTVIATLSDIPVDITPVFPAAGEK